MNGIGPMLSAPRLRRLARSAPRSGPEPEERCELCARAIPAGHRHLLDIPTRALLCVCQACSLLFDRREAGGGHYRLIPDRCLRLDGFELDDLFWAGLSIPVSLAFFCQSTQAGRVVAYYPGPMGTTEAFPAPESWRGLVAANPVLGAMEPDVEALLVNRAGGAREHWIVPIDVCFRLTGLIRKHWRGLGGGKEVWTEIDRFFAELGRRGRPRQVEKGG